MSVTFRPAVRAAIPLLLGVAGGTGSGKTFSALRLARGLADGKPFAFIDTENGRALHYADLFPEMQHAAIKAPFRPSAYADAIEAADKQGFPVIVVDSASHEWYGDGGCLDWHDELMDGKQAKNLTAWIEPKRDHKRMVTRLLQVKAHVILAFRAEPKVEAVKVDGKVEIRPKASLVGLDGWIPIAEKNLPYELTASFLLMADRPGVPRPIKLQEQHKSFVALNAPLDEETGKKLQAWAAGSQTPVAAAGAPSTPDQPSTPPSEPEATSSPAHPSGSEGLPLCTEGQADLIRFKADQAGLSDDERHELTEALTGQPSSKGVPKAMVDIVLREIAARAKA